MRILIIVTLLVLATSCRHLPDALSVAGQPGSAYRYQEPVLVEPFDSLGGWRSYDGGEGLYMTVEQGVYRIVLQQRQFVWTQTPAQYEDVIIEAEVKQVSDFIHNAYGIACRLDPGNSGRGYYFLIGGDGTFSIRWSNGRSLEKIVSAQPSDSIKTGKAINRIRVICIDDYLALWINDAFVTEARDKRASQGAVGLAAVMNYEGKRLELAFDDLRIWRGELDQAGT